MKDNACCCYRFTGSKFIFMKKIFSKKFAGMPLLFLQITATGFLVFYLASCSCKSYCGLMSAAALYKAHGQEEVVLAGNSINCDCYCNPNGKACQDSYGTIPNNSLDSNGKSPPVNVSSLPGEYFSATITAGPLLNFKSSNEEYGGGYGKHEPGVGFYVGVGTAFPLNRHWAIAPALRFTQKNASEKLSYTGGPGGGTMEFTDKYSYSYIGGTILAQYRVGKHVSIVAGPEVNYLISSRVKNGGSSGTGEKQNLTKSSNKVGFDILAGIKYEIPAAKGRSKWGVQLMYDHRFSRLNKKKDENGVDVPAYNMKSIQLGLAYNICGSCGKNK